MMIYCAWGPPDIGHVFEMNAIIIRFAAVKWKFQEQSPRNKGERALKVSFQFVFYFARTFTFLLVSQSYRA